MKRIAILLSALLFAVNVFGQANDQNKYAPIDFAKVIWNVSADSKGIIQGETWYKDFGNEAGNAYIYMIHKNGGNWWYAEAKKKFPKFYANYLMSNGEIKDKSVLKYYNKWAFFVDKKYLKPVLASSGSRGETVTDYYPRAPYVVVVYEQRADSNLWIEIDQKNFETEEASIKYTWEYAFVDQKLRESNANGPRE